MLNFEFKENKVLTGSFHLKKNQKKISYFEYMKKNMLNNMAYKLSPKSKGNQAKSFLKQLIKNYKDYRKNWIEKPNYYFNKKTYREDKSFLNSVPLCLDIEVAAVCDLACPFCFREHIVTPDKIIDQKLCLNLIEQAADLHIPSIKFNWRGEPLLHPKIFDFIYFAKKKGIMETIINTNATNLTSLNAEKLIDSGLDLLIYSFDGGSKETYEYMRPGRFKKNSFDLVYENIKNFKKFKTIKKSKFPYTKIQMILTDKTYLEVDKFYELFNDYVDDVTVNQYTERGGNLSDLSPNELNAFNSLIKKYNLPQDTPYMKNIFGEIKISRNRKPCKQPFQRLLVTYEGKVGMCCYDWGASHPVGYVDVKAFNNNKDYEQVFENVKKNKRGFELLKKVKMPCLNNIIDKKISSIKDIWLGEPINLVRDKHCEGESEKIAICKNCSFKDVYDWSD